MIRFHGFKCAYCGLFFDIDKSANSSHVAQMHDEVCEKHPWRKTDKELAEALNNYERADGHLHAIQETLHGPEYVAKNIDVRAEVRDLKRALDEERIQNVRLRDFLEKALPDNSCYIDAEHIRERLEEAPKLKRALRETEAANEDTRQKNVYLVGLVQAIREALAMDRSNNVDAFCEREILGTIHSLRLWDVGRAVKLREQAERKHAELIRELQTHPLWKIAIEWAADKLEVEVAKWQEKNIEGHDGALAFLRFIAREEQS